MPRPEIVQPYNKYMLRLRTNLLMDGRTEATVGNIFYTLLSITDKSMFSNLDFLKDTTKVLTKLKAISGTDSTYKTHLSRVMAALGGGESYDIYKKEFDDVKARYAAHIESHEKSEAEKEKLVPWERIMEVRTKLLEECAPLVKSCLTPKQYDKLQMLMLVMLHTEMAPRRNDYAIMDVVRTTADTGDKEMNYYVLETRKFVFNNYKTAKQYGQQVLEVPAHVADVVESVVCKRMEGKDSVPFLINQNGTRINPNTGISRLMTKAFGTPMGCTAMRHIFLAHAFPGLLEETEKRRQVAAAMAHSMAEQLRYIKR